MNLLQKAIIWFRGGVASTEHADNFVTNQITTAAYADNSGLKRGAVGMAATYACVSLLSETIASLPLQVLKQKGRTAERVDHPLSFVLSSPNYDQTPMDFWQGAAAGIELQGNAYALIERGARGVASLAPINGQPLARRNVDGAIEYQLPGESRWTPGDQVLHIRGPFGSALSGATPLSVCASSFADAAAVSSAVETIFGNGVRSSGILSTAKEVALTKEQRAELEALLIAKYTGAVNAGRPMLLDRGMTWTPININPIDAQMLESRRFSVEEICRIFGVPPHMIGHTEKTTSWGSGIEQQTLGFLRFTLRPRLKRIEQALEKQLLSAAERASGISISFNIEALLRADTQGRAQFYQTMTQIGAMTINEVRALENLPPVPGGDVPTLQMQNVPVGQNQAEKPL